MKLLLLGIVLVSLVACANNGTTVVKEQKIVIVHVPVPVKEVAKKVTHVEVTKKVIPTFRPFLVKTGKEKAVTKTVKFN